MELIAASTALSTRAALFLGRSAWSGLVEEGEHFESGRLVVPGEDMAPGEAPVVW